MTRIHQRDATSRRRSRRRFMTRWISAWAVAVLLFGTSNGLAQERDRDAEGDGDDSAMTVPSPPDGVAKMLELARLKPEDVVYDLGCGDGRIVVAAAKRYGCRAVGFDINPRMIREAQVNVKQHGVEDLVRIEQHDIFQLDLRKASVITLYLLPEMNDRLVPQLKRMAEGSRVVCHEFPIDRFQHDVMVTVKSTYDGVPRDVYLYTLPFKAKQSAE